MKNRKLELVLPREFLKALLNALKERGESLTPALVSELDKEIAKALNPLVAKESLNSVLGRIHRTLADGYDNK